MSAWTYTTNHLFGAWTETWFCSTNFSMSTSRTWCLLHLGDVETLLVACCWSLVSNLLKKKCRAKNHQTSGFHQKKWAPKHLATSGGFCIHHVSGFPCRFPSCKPKSARMPHMTSKRIGCVVDSKKNSCRNWWWHIHTRNISDIEYEYDRIRMYDQGFKPKLSLHISFQCNQCTS